MGPGERRSLGQWVEWSADLVIGMHGARVGVDATVAAEKGGAVSRVVSPHCRQVLAPLVCNSLVDPENGPPGLDAHCALDAERAAPQPGGETNFGDIGVRCGDLVVP